VIIAWVFDMDGVIIDSAEHMRFVLMATYRAHDDPSEPDFEKFFQSMGYPLECIMRTLDRPEEWASTYRAISAQQIPSLSLCLDVRESLQTLYDLKLPMAVLTGKERYRTIEILKHFGLLRYFSEVVCADDGLPAKPDPEPLEVILRALDVPSSQAVYIGDAPVDMQCATAAGVKGIGVLSGVASESELILAGASRVYPRLGQLFSASLTGQRNYIGEIDG